MGGWFSRADDIDLLVAQRLPKEVYRLILAYAVKLQNLVTLDLPACALWLVYENTVIVARHVWMVESGLGHALEKFDFANAEKVWSQRADQLSLCKLIVLDNGYIVGSTRTGLAVWNQEGASVAQVNVKEGCSNFCAMQGSKIAVQSLPNHLAVFNSSFEREWHVACKQGDSQAMITLGESVIVGHSNGHVSIWENAECVQDFQVCNSAVTSLCASKGLVFAGVYSGLVFACDLQGSVLRVFKGHDTRVKHLVCWGEKIAASSHTRTIRVWDMDSGGCQTLTNFGFPVTDLVVNKQKLIVGSQRCIRVWE